MARRSVCHTAFTLLLFAGLASAQETGGDQMPRVIVELTFGEESIEREVQ